MASMSSSLKPTVDKALVRCRKSLASLSCTKIPTKQMGLKEIRRVKQLWSDMYALTNTETVFSSQNFVVLHKLGISQLVTSSVTPHGLKLFMPFHLFFHVLLPGKAKHVRFGNRNTETVGSTVASPRRSTTVHTTGFETASNFPTSWT